MLRIKTRNSFDGLVERRKLLLPGGALFAVSMLCTRCAYFAIGDYGLTVNNAPCYGRGPLPDATTVTSILDSSSCGNDGHVCIPAKLRVVPTHAVSWWGTRGTCPAICARCLGPCFRSSLAEGQATHILLLG